MLTFHEHLRNIRKNHKSTQKKVATSIGVSERNYQDWEYGNTKPTFDVLIALANYFNVPIDFLVGRGFYENWEDVIKNKEAIIEVIEEEFPVFKKLELDKLNDIAFIQLLDALLEPIIIVDDVIELKFKISTKGELKITAKDKNDNVL